MNEPPGHYPRDMAGYGANPPDPQWPGDANLCLSIAVNYEAGAECSVLHGDTHSESVLTDTGFPAYEGARNLIVESAFEYGSRRGIWRILRILEERGITASIWAVVMALERNPEATRAMVAARSTTSSRLSGSSWLPDATPTRWPKTARTVTWASSSATC